MIRPLRVSATILALVLAGAPAASAATLVGFVRSALRPVEGVHVLVPAIGAYAQSDSTGRFALTGVPVGVHELRLVAVGYRPAAGRVAVAAADADAPVDAGSWVLEPLHPDGAGPGFVAPPEPAPLAPAFTLHRTAAEAARWPEIAGLTTAGEGPDFAAPAAAFADLLRRIAAADSITAATGGTGAPGFETWRQWADRLDVFAADSMRAREPRLAADSALVLRAGAYTRTRAALAAGRTTTGYALASRARAGLARSRRADGGDAAASTGLAAALDSVFVPGSVPPKPPPAKKSRAKSRRRGR